MSESHEGFSLLGKIGLLLVLMLIKKSDLRQTFKEPRMNLVIVVDDFILVSFFKIYSKNSHSEFLANYLKQLLVLTR
ncbi:hypothetical protein [Enterococcus hirae]|uniref:hypothetical protein n=1 Tax=Enterococcus TaxID=1350 RepID=UPI0004D42C49|nr:hypothetical protein [Enterococcus hirae]EMF0155318.1 hypothetical protein [Enterococcus hirae]KDR93464.1 hypothetical protein EI18_06455 [Enterococcus hirae]MBA5259005.1 hypothetical protein [Enterococcus hirae]MBA5278987.1 hypothetical protein [Enterococcus hirae]MCO5489732.1 hypothetical protein [Enterococcus hirae]